MDNKGGEWKMEIRFFPNILISQFPNLCRYKGVEKMLKSFFDDESGQGMTEYILIIALIAVVCIGAIKVFGVQIKELIVDSTSKIRKETKSFNQD